MIYQFWFYFLKKHFKFKTHLKRVFDSVIYDFEIYMFPSVFCTYLKMYVYMLINSSACEIFVYTIRNKHTHIIYVLYQFCT